MYRKYNVDIATLPRMQVVSEHSMHHKGSGGETPKCTIHSL